jgi:DNA end-binding protein Ku
VSALVDRGWIPAYSLLLRLALENLFDYPLRSLGQVVQGGSVHMATTVWKGHLTFGLVSIPINLFSAARSERISLNQIHKECSSRLKQPLFCPTCNRNVERSELVKGYEYEKDQYLLFDEGELDKLEPESARSMEILEFVKLDEVDPLYFDASYYATPEDAGKKAYGLLFKAMENSGYGAIAKLTMHQRENIVVIRPRANGLTLHTMFYSNEIRKLSEYGLPHTDEIKEQEMKLAQQLIESLAVPFEADKYRDEYQESLRGLIEAKLKGQNVAAPPIRKLAPVIDLMEALKKSLTDKPTIKKPPARSLSAAAPEQKKPRKKSA